MQILSVKKIHIFYTETILNKNHWLYEKTVLFQKVFGKHFKEFKK